jgi:phospholipid-binding lipoprotein MlaA
MSTSAGLRPIIFTLALIVAMAVWPSSSKTQSLQEITALLNSIVSQNQLFTDQEVATAQRLGNSYLAADYQRRGLRRLETEIETQTIHWISRHPALAREIITAAINAAPEIQELLASQLFATFPGLASEITNATGVDTPYLLKFVAQTRPVKVTASPPLYAVAPAPRPAFTNTQTARVTTEHFTVEDDLLALGIEAISDPIEPVNRMIFAFNDTVDIMILRPISAIYGFVTPEVIKSAFRRMFENLNQPVVFANDLLQLDVIDAGVAAGRFVINSTVGVLGIFDVAQAVGLDSHTADFGQTLHSYGVGAGPYIVLPLMGPSTLRDAAGNGVDTFLQPLPYILNSEVNFAIKATNAIAVRERLLKPLDEMRTSSIDYYSALRAAYYQNRAVDLRKGRGGDTSSVDALFDRAE